MKLFLFIILNIQYVIGFCQSDFFETEQDRILIQKNKIQMVESYTIDCDLFFRHRVLDSKTFYDSCGNDTLYQVYDQKKIVETYRNNYQYGENCKNLKSQEYKNNNLINTVQYQNEVFNNIEEITIYNISTVYKNKYRLYFEKYNIIKEERYNTDDTIDYIITYNYDENNRVIEESQFSSNPIDTIKCIYTYNHEGKKIKELWKSSNDFSEEIFLFSYKRSNRFITELFYEDNILSEKYITKLNRLGLEKKMIEIDVENGKRIEKTISKYSKYKIN